jgi:hypothetical protein
MPKSRLHYRYAGKRTLNVLQFFRPFSDSPKVSRNTVNFSALDVPGTAFRIRLSSTAVHVQHDGNPNKANSIIVAYSKGGKLYRVQGRSAILAGLRSTL